MKLLAPEYYNDFKCIADKCRHSCCVGWEIDVDGDTMARYEALDSGYGPEIIGSIEKGDTPHFRLCEKDRCPHLDERGLCRIITELGKGTFAISAASIRGFITTRPTAKRWDSVCPARRRHGSCFPRIAMGIS